MAQEQKDKQDNDVNPNNSEWYDKTLEDIRNLSESAESEQKSVAEQELSAASSDGQSDIPTSSKEYGAFKYSVTGKSERKSKKKRNIVFGVLGISVVGGVFGAAFIVPTLGLKILTTRLTDAFTDRVNYAITERMDRLVDGYFQKMLSPAAITRCGTRITSDCSVFEPGTGIAGNLYRNWKNTRIESKLFDKHGITFERATRNSNVITVYKTNQFGVKGEIGTFGERTVSREVSKFIRQSDETSGVLERWKYRSLISNKYGGKLWCVIACDKRDDVDIRLNPVQRLQYKLIGRIAEPINGKAAAYMFCFLNQCDADRLQREISEAATDAIQRLGRENLQEIGDKIGDKTMTQYLKERITAQILEKVLQQAPEVAAQTAGKTVPVVGWVYFGLTVLDVVDQMDKQINDGIIQQFARDLRNEAAINYWSDWQVISDDAWSLQAPLVDLGAAFSIASSFNQSRVYQAANGQVPTSSTECDDGVVLEGPDAPLACPELNMNPGTNLDNAWNLYKNTSGVGIVLDAYNRCALVICVPGVPDSIQEVVHPALRGVNWALGQLGSAIFTGLNFLTFGTMDSITNWAGEQAVDLLTWAGEKMFGTGINPIAIGGKVADQIGAGLDTFANLFLKGEIIGADNYGLGARAITEEEGAKLDLAIAERRAEELQGSSAFVRYLDVHNPDSLLASAVGGATGSVQPNGVLNFASILNPLSSITNISSTLSGTQEANAFTLTNRKSIYNNTQYAYTANAAEFDIDPATLTPEKCDEYASIREATKFQDPDTREFIYTQTNPCELEDTIVDILIKPTNLDTEGSSNIGAGGTGTIVNGVNCGGYSTASLSGTADNQYNDAIRAQCERLVSECSSVASNDTKKIVCEALNFDGTYYGNSYGSYSGTKANQIYGFTAPPTVCDFGICAEQWLANRTEGLSPNNLLECSGLTSVALYKAFNYDGESIGCSGNYTERNNPSLFRQLQPDEIQPGDFLTKTFGCNSGGSGHVAIAASTVDANGNIIVYETDSWGKPVRFTQKNLNSDFPAGRSRYIGPGAQ